MKVKLDITPTCTEPEIIIKAEQMNEEIESIITFISDIGDKHKQLPITGTMDDKIVILEPESIVRVYASHGKVFAETVQDMYEIKLKLYELEELLSSSKFVRISKSEIINLKAVKHFDVSFTATIEIVFINNKKTYVSRRYIKKLKERLGM